MLYKKSLLCRSIAINMIFFVPFMHGMDIFGDLNEQRLQDVLNDVAEINRASDERFMTPLYVAVVNDYVEVAKLLFSYNADIYHRVTNDDQLIDSDSVYALWKEQKLSQKMMLVIGNAIQ